MQRPSGRYAHTKDYVEGEWRPVPLGPPVDKRDHLSDRLIDQLRYLMWGSLAAHVSFFGMKCFQLGSGGHDPGIPQWLPSAISAAMIFVAGSFSQCFGSKTLPFNTYMMNGSTLQILAEPQKQLTINDH